PAASYDDARPSAAVTPMMVGGGGHVGFHARGDDGVAWRDRVVADWFDHCFDKASATAGAK
ncbi:MAG: hypothetical protein AAF684_00585, partial [Pseudomonadota bacterium]